MKRNTIYRLLCVVSVIFVSSCTTDMFITPPSSEEQARDVGSHSEGFWMVKSALEYYRTHSSEFSVVNNQNIEPKSIKWGKSGLAFDKESNAILSVPISTDIDNPARYLLKIKVDKNRLVKEMYFVRNIPDEEYFDIHGGDMYYEDFCGTSDIFSMNGRLVAKQKFMQTDSISSRIDLPEVVCTGKYTGGGTWKDDRKDFYTDPHCPLCNVEADVSAIESGGGGCGNCGYESDGNTSSTNGIYKNCTLDKKSKDSVFKQINRVFHERCAYRAMRNALKKAKGGFSDIVIAAGSNNYDPTTGIYTLSSAGYASISFPEEFVHLFQNNVYDKGISQYSNKEGNANIEFEAKFINDITSYLVSENEYYHYGEGVELSNYYNRWIKDVAEKAKKGNLKYDYIKDGYYDPDLKIKITYAQFLEDWAKRWDINPQIKNKYGTSRISTNLEPKVIQLIVRSLYCI